MDKKTMYYIIKLSDDLYEKTKCQICYGKNPNTKKNTKEKKL